MIQVKTKHLKSLYDAKRKSLDTYEAKKAFDEHAEIVLGVAMDRIERWQLEPKPKEDSIDEAVGMVKDALTGDMPDFSAPPDPEESSETGESEKGDSPSETKETEEVKQDEETLL